MRPFSSLALAACLALPLAHPASAERLVIEGRAAQALHCASMIMIVGVVLRETGEISEKQFSEATVGVVMIMDHVPGTEAQKIKAIKQRAAKIIDTRTPEQLAKEFTATADWCAAKFL